MKLLITGASGFLGRNILLSLPKDWKVVATYFKDETFIEFLKQNNLNQIQDLRIDLANSDSYKNFSNDLKSFDACIYLSANGDPAYSVQAPLIDLRSNVTALINVLENCDFKKFIYFSSGAVYDGLSGNVNPDSYLSPTLPYAISKWSAERYVMHAEKIGKIGIATVVRFFGAYGPHEAPRKIYGRLIKQFGIKKNPEFTIRGNGKNLIDAMYIDDLVDAIFLILDKASKTQTIDLFSGNSISLKKLVEQTANIFGIEAKINFNGTVPEFIEFNSNDITMKKDFNFSPKTSLKEGLLKFHDWMNKNNE
jgi:nucleoside-diphosphate-sugar epimerase